MSGTIQAEQHILLSTRVF